MFDGTDNTYGSTQSTEGTAPRTKGKRLPKIEDVARELRAASARLSGPSLVYLYITLNGDWSIHPGAPDPLSPGWTAVGEVPGQNGKGAAKRFRSTDLARQMLTMVKGEKSSGPRTTDPASVVPPPGFVPPMSSLAPVHDIGALVQVHRSTGRVVGHTVIYTQFGPQRCHLVEFDQPQYIAAWDMHVQVVPVADTMIKPHASAPARRRAAKGSTTPKFT